MEHIKRECVLRFVSVLSANVSVNACVGGEGEKQGIPSFSIT
jgi:hypothetical protein